jgi:hypothetical protein
MGGLSLFARLVGCWHDGLISLVFKAAITLDAGSDAGLHLAAHRPERLDPPQHRW